MFKRRLLTLVLASLTALTACSKDKPQPLGVTPTVSPTFPSKPITVTKETVFTTVSPVDASTPITPTTPGITNWVFVPANYDVSHNTPMELFVWLHGCGGRSQYDVSMVSKMPNQNWISLAVGGREGTCWSWSGSVPTDSPKVLSAIADLKTHLNIDPRKVILGGYSSGGDIGYPLVMQNAELFAGALFTNTGPGSVALNASKTAAWKLNITHLAHLSDTTYPITSVRTNMSTLRTNGFPVTLLEKPGGHYDADNGTTGTTYDLRTFLLPYLNSGWMAPVPGSTPAPTSTPTTPTPVPTCCPCPDAGVPDASVTPTYPFTARAQVYNTWAGGNGGYCSYLFVKNNTTAAKSWTAMKVSMQDGSLRDHWTVKTTSVWGAMNTVVFTPGAVASIGAQQEFNVGGFCADNGISKKSAVVTGVE